MFDGLRRTDRQGGAPHADRPLSRLSRLQRLSALNAAAFNDPWDVCCKFFQCRGTQRHHVVRLQSDESGSTRRTFRRVCATHTRQTQCVDGCYNIEFTGERAHTLTAVSVCHCAPRLAHHPDNSTHRARISWKSLALDDNTHTHWHTNHAHCSQDSWRTHIAFPDVGLGLRRIVCVFYMSTARKKELTGRQTLTRWTSSSRDSLSVSEREREREKTMMAL